MNDYAYLLDDPLWPPVLHQVKDTDPETGLKIVSPVNNPNRVMFVYEDDLWVMATI